MADAELQCPYCPRTIKNQAGLSLHVKKSHKDKPPLNSSQVSTLIPNSAIVPDSKGMFHCPDCTHTPFKTRLQVGKHRRFAHGVIGRIAQKRIAAEATNGHALQTRGTVHGETVPHIEASSGTTIDPIALALAVGSVKEFCRNLAEEHDLPTRMFTRQFAELFYRQARR